MSENGDYKWDDQTRDQRDLIVQSSISIVFGLAAFIAFCVCHGELPRLGGTLLTVSLIIVPQTAMDGALCRTQETEGRGFKATRIARFFPRVDTNALQDLRGRNPCLSWA